MKESVTIIYNTETVTLLLKVQNCFILLIMFLYKIVKKTTNTLYR